MPLSSEGRQFAGALGREIGRQMREDLLDVAPIDTLGYLPMTGRRYYDEDPYFAESVKYGSSPKYATGFPVTREEARQWFRGRSRRNGKATVRAMFTPAPSLHGLTRKRVPPPGRVDFDHDRFTVAPELALRLAGTSAYAEHLVLRLLRDDQGKVILWKLAMSMRAVARQA